MAVRQYVGARYVPKFYQNSTDPSGTAWEGNRSYEALTVVSYNNDSYTSKIPVPAGIGNPANNPTYWARTGAYNAQVEQYRQEVVTTVEDINTKLNDTTTKLEQSVQQVQDQANEIQSNLTEEITARANADTSIKKAINNNLANRKFLIVSDSYGGDGLTSKKWNYYCKKDLGITDTNWLDKSISGSGFTVTGTTSTASGNFLDQISGQDTLAIGDEITDIVIVGGLNDSKPGLNLDGSLQNLLTTAINNFIDYANEHYPNANIWFGYAGNAIDNSDYLAGRTLTERTRCRFMYDSIAMQRKCRIMPKLAETWATTTDQFYDVDKVHPTFGYDGCGGDYLGIAVAQNLIGGTTKVNYSVPTFETVAGTANTFNYTIAPTTDNYFIQLGNDPVQNITPSNGTIPLSNTGTIIGTMSHVYFNKPYTTSCNMLVQAGGQLQTIQGAISFEGNAIKLYAYSYADGQATTINAESVWIMTTSFTIPNWMVV